MINSNFNSKEESINSMYQSDNDNLDLRDLCRFFDRNKNLITKFVIIGSLTSFVYSLSLKKVWKGEFQIVLQNNDSKLGLPSSVNTNMAELAGIKFSDNDNIQTEVGILKSPSVLSSVFSHVKDKKLSKQNKSFENLEFEDWRENYLDINLTKSTSILNINYLDTDKELIIPTLERISKAYQEYSGKRRLRTIQLALNYFEDQILKYTKKSSESLKVAQEYAIDQDLVLYDYGKETQNNLDNNPDQLIDNNLFQVPNLLLPNIGIENARVQAANQIRKINLQLMKIKELDEAEELQYIGSTIPALAAEGLPKQLSDIESDLLKARSKYTDKDIFIKNLIRKRNLAIDLLKDRTIKYLEAQKLNAEATMKASMRPKGVLLKYKELIREAGRDEQTLINLENSYKKVLLEKAKVEDPWELITTPTLLKNEVSPNKKIITFFGLIISFCLGSFLSFFKEKRSDLIFNTNQIKNLNKFKSIEEININNSSDIKNSLNILSKSSLISNQDFVILTVGKINKKFISLINSKISKSSLSFKVALTNDIKEINPSQNIILLTALKITTMKELCKVNEYLKLLGNEYIHTYIVKDIEEIKNEND